jgi:hypothetical protein
MDVLMLLPDDDARHDKRGEDETQNGGEESV